MYIVQQCISSFVFVQRVGVFSRFDRLVVFAAVALLGHLDKASISHHFPPSPGPARVPITDARGRCRTSFLISASVSYSNDASRMKLTTLFLAAIHVNAPLFVEA
jgi:hypothetical protein